MGTTADKLSRVAITKTQIREALTEKGINMSGVVFSEYADKIRNLNVSVSVPEIADLFRSRLTEAMAANPQYGYGMVLVLEMSNFLPVHTLTFEAGMACSDNSTVTGEITNSRCTYKFILSDGAEYSNNFKHAYDQSKYIEINGTKYMYVILLGDGNNLRANVIKINDVASNSYLYQYARYIILSGDACAFAPGDFSKSGLLDYIEFGRNSICFGVNQNIAYAGFRYANPRYIYNLNLDRITSTAESVFPNNVEFVTVRNIQKNLNLTGRGLLSEDSVINILNALCDNTEGATVLSLTLPALIFAALSDEMKAIASNKNWTIIKGADY